MKSTGIIRKVDDLGRIVLPIELRRTLDIAERDELEIYMENDRIILQKFEPACVFAALPGHWCPTVAKMFARSASRTWRNPEKRLKKP